jgi:anaerobic selenocysteine-containing dehydrogenase
MEVQQGRGSAVEDGADGKAIEPAWKSLPGPFSLAYKKRVYSPNRIKYPLKRVDWDPNGEPQYPEPGQKQIQAHLLG